MFVTWNIFALASRIPYKSPSGMALASVVSGRVQAVLADIAALGSVGGAFVNVWR